MEPEPRVRTRAVGGRDESSFPPYVKDETAANNYIRLRLFLEKAMEAELVLELENERDRIKRLTKDRVRLLFKHFEQELKRKRDSPEGHYTYKRIDETRLVIPSRAMTTEELAVEYAALDTRNKLLEKLHEADMQELALLIEEFRGKGFVSDAQTDAILKKVNTQCEPLREENRKLREQLDQRQSKSTILELAEFDLNFQVQQQRDELQQLRLQLRECVGKDDQLALLESANAELLQRPGHEVVAEKLLQIADLSLQLNERDNQIETLERDLEEARKREERQHEMDKGREQLAANEQGRELLIERMSEVIEAQETEIERLRGRLDIERTRMEGFDPRALRLELEASKLEYDKMYNERAEIEEELTRLCEEDLRDLNNLPIYRMDPRTLTPQETGETLGVLREQKRAFFVVEAPSLLRPDRVVALGHFMSPEQDALRALLLKAAKGQSGRYRVRVSLENVEGTQQFDLMLEALAPQKIAAFRELELVLDFDQSNRLRYIRPGALPLRMMRPDGQLRVQRYDADRTLGEESLYRFTLEGRGVCVVRFDDGALLYASYMSASMYRLDLLVLPLNKR